jgi:hypothetical protein
VGRTARHTPRYDSSRERSSFGDRTSERFRRQATAGPFPPDKVLRFTNQETLMATEAVALAFLDEVERLDSIRPVPPRGTSRRRETL